MTPIREDSSAASVSAPSASVDLPEIDVGGLPGAEIVQVKPPSSLIESAILAFPGAEAVQSPVRFPGSTAAGCGGAGGAEGVSVADSAG